MIIKVENYSKILKKKDILVDVNYTFKSGNIYGLYGQNGSGKSMFLRALAGLIRPTTGSIEVDGKMLGKDISYPEEMGIIIEHTKLLKEYTGLENLKVLNKIDKNLNEEELIQVLKSVGLENAINTKVGKYSLGMNQKLVIAQAIMGNPKLLLIDEPFNALDEETVGKIKKILFKLKEEGTLIIFASHEKEIFEELSDIVLEIKSGIVKEIKNEKK